MILSPSCQVLLVREKLAEFAKGKMCGRCLPCPAGVYVALATLDRLSHGQGREADLERLALLGRLLPGLARCVRGREAGEWIAHLVSEDETLREHLSRRCPAGQCGPLRKYRVIPEKCSMCDRCREVCSQEAILGEPYVAWRGDNRPYQIVLALCDGCGRCLEVCPEQAIERV